MNSGIRKHYRNAPVAEAVIDIQVPLLKASDALTALVGLASKMEPDFPTRLPMHELQMGFHHDADKQVANFHNNQALLGWRLNGKENARVLQIKTTGFTYSHMPPYSEWNTFSSEAESLWTEYVAECKPSKANRCAVRMINRLAIDPADMKLDSYLNLFPTVPEQIPQNADAMFMQLQMPMKHVDPNASVILSLYTSPMVPNSPQTTGLTLDIDFFVERPIAVDKGVFQIINLLGEAKDTVFEACITDKVREMIS